MKIYKRIHNIQNILKILSWSNIKVFLQKFFFPVSESAVKNIVQIMTSYMYLEFFKVLLKVRY